MLSRAPWDCHQSASGLFRTEFPAHVAPGPSAASTNNGALGVALDVHVQVVLMRPIVVRRQHVREQPAPRDIANQVSESDGFSGLGEDSTTRATCRRAQLAGKVMLDLEQATVSKLERDDIGCQTVCMLAQLPAA